MQSVTGIQYSQERLVTIRRQKRQIGLQIGCRTKQNIAKYDVELIAAATYLNLSNFMRENPVIA